MKKSETFVLDLFLCLLYLESKKTTGEIHIHNKVISVKGEIGLSLYCMEDYQHYKIFNLMVV